jgi:hypothetical protein
MNQHSSCGCSTTNQHNQQWIITVRAPNQSTVDHHSPCAQSINSESAQLMRVFNSESTQIMHTINSESPQSVRSTNSGSSQFMPTTNNGWTQPARTVQPTMHSPCKQSTSRTCRVRGGPRAMQMLKHPLKGAGSHPLTQAKSAQHCSATRRLPCKRAHITWPSGQHGRYSALVPCSNHMPHTFNTHSTHTLLSTHSTHTLPTLSPTHSKQTRRHQQKRNDLVQKHYRTAHTSTIHTPKTNTTTPTQT